MKIENSHLLSNCNKISYIRILILKKSYSLTYKIRAAQEAKEQQILKEQHREWVQRTLEENKRRIEEKKKNGR
jgi:hypothetical protein